MKTSRHLAPLLLLLLVASCGHQRQVSQITVASIQAAVEATNATRDLVIMTTDEEQKQIVEATEQAVANLPSTLTPEQRAEEVNNWKASAKSQLAAVRTRRDNSLRATAKAYQALAKAALIVPLVETRPELQPEVVKLITDAYAVIKETD